MNTEQSPNNKTPRHRNPTEWRTGNTEDAPSERAWDPQGIGGATDAPGPQVFHLVKRLKSQGKKKLKVSDHAPSKNKNITIRCSINRVMEHTPIKKSTQSGEQHHQAISDQQRFILGRYNPSKEVTNINKLHKSYFTIIKTPESK